MATSMTDRPSNPLRRLAALPARFPRVLRWMLVAISLAVVFWLALSPVDDLPTVSMADKVQHALAFSTLTLAYGLMFPGRPRRLAAAMLGLGILIEVLQGVMPFGRDAEFADVIADAVGITAGFIALRLLTGPLRLPT
jgi:VanZ family protein